MKRVLVLGGYGNFGGYIARELAKDRAIQLIIGGRSVERARSFAGELAAVQPAEAVSLNVRGDVSGALTGLAPDIVIHTVGPFQDQDYRVAKACIAAGAHYLDLADARRFVSQIGNLNAPARERGVCIIGGASSVPCLSAAIVDHYLPQLRELLAIDYGITAAQQTNRGLGTASAVLSYIGRPFKSLRNGQPADVIGWQDLHSVDYPELRRRWFGNCDIPDLELFPARYPTLFDIRFGAGHEITLLQLGTWLLSGGVRAGLLPRLDRLSGPLLKASFLFDRLGSSRSGMHMFLSGIGQDGRPKSIRFFLIARSGHGPLIPCMPVIIMARRMAAGQLPEPGARPCLDLIDLPTYLGALHGLDISVIVNGADAPA